MVVPTYNGRVIYGPSEVDVPFGGGVVFIGRYLPTKNIQVLSADVEAIPGDLVKALLNGLPEGKRLKVRVENLTNTLSLVENTPVVVDSDNRVSQQEAVINAFQFLDNDEQASQLVVDAHWLNSNSNEEQLAKDDIRLEVFRRIDHWKEQPATASLFEGPASSARTQTLPGVKSALDRLSFFRETALSASPTVDGLTARSKQILAEVNQVLDRDAQALRNALKPHVPSLAAYDAWKRNAGEVSGTVHIISVPDTATAFQQNADELAKVIRNLGLSYADLVVAEPLSPEVAADFIAKLGTNIHGCIYLGLTQYASQSQLQQIAPKAPATQQAANVYLIGGKGTYRGISGLSMAAAAAAMRKRIDQFLSTQQYGVFEPTFGRKGPKDLLGYDSVDTCEWPVDSVISMAAEKKVNGFIYNPQTGVRTLALDRAWCCLASKQQFTANRALQMLLGSIRACVTVQVPGNVGDPQIVRETLRLIEERYFKPLAHTPGLKASITHTGSIVPGNLGLKLGYSMPTPYESYTIEVDTAD